MGRAKINMSVPQPSVYEDPKEKNAIKYIARADHKGNRKEDLEKARWYIDRALEQSNDK